MWERSLLLSIIRGGNSFPKPRARPGPNLIYGLPYVSSICNVVILLLSLDRCFCKSHISLPRTNNKMQIKMGMISKSTLPFFWCRCFDAGHPVLRPCQMLALVFLLTSRCSSSYGWAFFLGQIKLTRTSTWLGLQLGSWSNWPDPNLYLYDC